ncbi:MAG: hypothetical protein ACRDFB_03470, partial [Rhabdochlamydiaceae bacterium]
ALLEVKVPRRINLGETFEIAIKPINQGNTARQQIVYVEFPTLDSAKNMKITSPDMKSKFVEIGDKIGSSYAGSEKPITAKYPMIEIIASPWRRMYVYDIKIQARPRLAEKFIVFVKVVAFPHPKSAHYPKRGTRDHQNEFVKTYEIMVHELPYQQREEAATAKAEINIVEHKAKPLRVEAPIAVAAQPHHSGFEYLNTEFDLILTQMTETRKEVTATRKEIEDLKNMLFRI